jgi:hypothetical protein
MGYPSDLSTIQTVLGLKSQAHTAGSLRNRTHYTMHCRLVLYQFDQRYVASVHQFLSLQTRDKKVARITVFVYYQLVIVMGP